jgi:hypothetical protein
VIWTVLGQNRTSGKLETFVLMKDGADSRKKAFDEASRSVAVIAIIQGNHVNSMTLYSPFKSENMRLEEERINKEHFQRCSEYWEGI